MFPSCCCSSRGSGGAERQFTPFVLPSLSSVIERIWTDAVSGDLAINTGLTVYRAMVGFLIAMVGGSS